MRSLLWNVFKLLVIAMVIYGIYDSYLRPETPVHTVSTEQAETILNRVSVDYADVVVGESRRTGELIVYEQDLSVTQTITSSLLNIDLFRRSMDVTSYGTAIYTIDLSSVKAEDVSYQEETASLSVAVPHAALKTVDVHAEQTEFSDIDRGILGWGDIRLTPEQENLLQQELYRELAAEAQSSANLIKADNSGEDAVRTLFRTVLAKTDPGIRVEIIFREQAG